MLYHVKVGEVFVRIGDKKIKRPNFFLQSINMTVKHVINLQVLLFIVFALSCLCVMKKGKI